MEVQSFNCIKVRGRDYQAWLSLNQKLWPDCSLRDLKKLFADILKSPRLVSFVCWNEKKQAVGFANISLRVDYVEGSDSSPVGYLEGVYVEAAYRKQGIARLLVTEAEKWALQKGAKEIASDTELHNKLSQKFHQAIGFKKAETIVHYIKKIKKKGI